MAGDVSPVAMFLFKIACLESPPQHFFDFNGNFNGKMTKINKMAKVTFRRDIYLSFSRCFGDN